MRLIHRAVAPDRSDATAWLDTLAVLAERQRSRRSADANGHTGLGHGRGGGHALDRDLLPRPGAGVARR